MTFHFWLTFPYFCANVFVNDWNIIIVSSKSQINILSVSVPSVKPPNGDDGFNDATIDVDGCCCCCCDCDCLPRFDVLFDFEAKLKVLRIKWESKKRTSKYFLSWFSVN